MKKLTRTGAKRKITEIFKNYRTLSAGDVALLDNLKSGKLYELYVLSILTLELRRRGFRLTFIGSSLAFKKSPGQIKASDPHFLVFRPGDNQESFRIFVDIECQTLGSFHSSVTDNSRLHELDIVVVEPRAARYPRHEEIVLGVECKAVANFGKSIIKEALGVRRELSLLAFPLPSALAPPGSSLSSGIPADPPSEFWLAYIDPKGNAYRQSPATFGIDLRHIEPPAPVSPKPSARLKMPKTRRLVGKAILVPSP